MKRRVGVELIGGGRDDRFSSRQGAAMNDLEPTSQFASMEAILASLAQPVWVVDHDGFVVFVNPARLAGHVDADLSDLRARFGHDAIHYKHRDGSSYPAEDC